MVEICRWPKASFSASLIACMETPRRPAVSRSTLTRARRPPSCASDTTSRSTGDLRSFSTSLADHVETSSASLPTSVYWYCARLTLRADLDVLHGLEEHGEAGCLRCRLLQARDDLVDGRLRCSRGFSVIFRWPALGVGLMALTPMIVTTPSTAGFLRIASVAAACRRSISAKETSGPPSSVAMMRPVSCCGRKPLGTIA